MNRFLFTVVAVALLSLASCSKEDNPTPDNCYENQVAATFVNVTGLSQAPGQLAGSELPDSERSLTISAVSCNVVKVQVGATLGAFEADCYSSGNVISGSSTDTNSNYAYDNSTKQITVKFTASNGIVYNLTGKR